MDANGTLAFEETNDVGNRVFWRNGDEEMDVIGTGIAFEDLAFLLLYQFPDDFTDLDSDLTEEDLFPVLGYNHDVVFAVPHRVTRCLQRAHEKEREMLLRGLSHA